MFACWTRMVLRDEEEYFLWCISTITNKKQHVVRKADGLLSVIVTYTLMFEKRDWLLGFLCGSKTAIKFFQYGMKWIPISQFDEALFSKKKSKCWNLNEFQCRGILYSSSPPIHRSMRCWACWPFAAIPANKLVLVRSLANTYELIIYSLKERISNEFR